MNIALLILHVILSLGIITLVLLQKGAGASAGAAFGGGGGAGSVFGASGSSNFLSKTTAILATAFFANSLLLAYLAAHREVHNDSVIESLVAPQSEEVVVPAADAPITLPENLDEVIPPAADSDVMSGEDFTLPPPATDESPESSEGAAQSSAEGGEKQ